MNKIFILLVPIFLLLSGYVSASYYVETELANPAISVWFQFDSDGNNLFDKDSNNAVWGGDVGINEYLTYGYVSKFNLNFYDSKGGTFQYSTTGYCVDLKTNYGDGVAGLEDLTGNQKKAAWLLDYSANSLNHNDTPNDNIALQLAIWDVLYGDRFNMREGLTSDEIYASYEDYITALDFNEYNGDDYQILTFNDTQDMIVKTVPLPPAILLMGLGLMGISSVRRTKSFKA